jgi:hypothetical protein
MTNTDPWEIDETHYSVSGSMPDRLRFLLQYAVLAPSSHNTQPWKFRIDGNRIDIFMDDERWLKVCDDDQRELHISVGCCLENLLVAADHFGLRDQVEYLPDASDPMHAATMELRDGTATERDSKLFQMIPVRHTNHGSYDGRPIPEDVLEKLSGCCTEPNIHVQLTSDNSIKQKIDALVVQADAMEFADPAFREELGYWIGQGVFGTSWLMSKIGKLAVTHINMGSSTAKKDSAVLMSSPVLGLISSKDNSRETQIKVGQVYQRLSLTAASFGIWCQPMSQIVQVEETKQEVAKLQTDPYLFPQLPFRLGFAESEKHRTPRRSVEEVLVEQNE